MKTGTVAAMALLASLALPTGTLQASPSQADMRPRLTTSPRPRLESPVGLLVDFEAVKGEPGKPVTSVSRIKFSGAELDFGKVPSPPASPTSPMPAGRASSLPGDSFFDPENKFITFQQGLLGGPTKVAVDFTPIGGASQFSVDVAEMKANGNVVKVEWFDAAHESLGSKTMRFGDEPVFTVSVESDEPIATAELSSTSRKFGIGFDNLSVTPTPEPASLAIWTLLGLGGSLYLYRRSRKPRR